MDFKLIFILLLGFLLGWLFPIQGPYDDTYNLYIFEKFLQNPPVAIPDIHYDKTHNLCYTNYE